MTSKTDKGIILRNDPRAARIQTVTGWVSSNGHFWGDKEYLARVDGSTHQDCECGELIEKRYTRCSKCQESRYRARWEAMPKKEWDGETPLTLLDDDHYFYGVEEIEDYCDEYETTPDKLLLVICQPVYIREFDINEHCCDDLPDDGEVDDPDVLEAVKKLNEAIKKADPIAWESGQFAAIVKGLES